MDRSLEDLLLAVDQLGKQQTEPAGFYRELFTRLLQSGPLVSLTVWSARPDAVQCRATSRSASEPVQSPDASLIQTALAQRVTPLGTTADPEILLAGETLAGDESVLLEATPSTRFPAETTRRFLVALTELVAVAETRFRYLESRSALDDLTNLSQTITRLHSGTTLTETALLVAEETQSTLGFDRGWVCDPDSHSPRVLATAASVDIARRDTLIRTVEAVADEALQTGRNWTWSMGEPLPTALPSLAALAQEGSARQIRIEVLSTSVPVKPVAILLLERFQTSDSTASDTRLNALRPHLLSALQQARRLEQTGWRHWLLPASQRSRIKRLLTTGATLLALLWLLWPVPTKIDVEGRLMPVTVRSVYAPADGLVATLNIQHGQSVTKDQPVLTLRSPALELDRERLLGQISELKARQSALQVLRTQGRRTSATDSQTDLSAQEEQLTVALKGAEAQRELVRQQLEELSLHSPIDGVVDRWDLQEALSSRPVVRGQHLLDIMAVSGDWQLDLAIPDRQAGTVLEAGLDRSELTVNYRLRSAPAEEYNTHLASLGERTELDSQGRLILRGRAPVAAESGPPLRAGASVSAHIVCGRQARVVRWLTSLWHRIAF